MKKTIRTRSAFRNLPLVIGVAALLGQTLHTQATDRTWGAGALGAGNDNFNVANRWTGNIVPAVGDNAILNNGNTVTITDTRTFTDMISGSSGTANNTYNQTAGTVTINGWFRAAEVTGTTGNFTISGGTLAATLELHVSEGGTGFFTNNGGTVTAAGTTKLGSRADFGTGSTSTMVLNSGSYTANGELWVGNGAGGTGTAGTLNLSGGTLNVNNWLAVGRNSAQGVVNMTGGNLTKAGGATTALTLAGIGTAQTGTFNQSGGNLTNTASLTWIGETGNGVYNLSGTGNAFLGTVSVGYSGKGIMNVGAGTFRSSQFNVGGNQTATSSAQGHVVQTGGAVTLSGGDNRIGGAFSTADVNCIGVYAMSAGTLSVGGNFQIGAFGNGELNLSGSSTWTQTGGFPGAGRFVGAFGVVDINGGTLNNSSGNSFIVGEQGTGTLNLRSGALTNTSVSMANALSIGHTATGVGVVNLIGGTLNTLSVGNPAAAGNSSTFNFNGGTLQARGANTTFLQGLTACYVFPNGAVIDGQGNAITINQNLLAPLGSGVSSIPVLTAGVGYVTAPIVKITGGGGTSATAVAVMSGTSPNMTVSSILITSPGVNYTTPPTVTLLGGGFTTAATTLAAVTLPNVSTGGLT